MHTFGPEVGQVFVDRIDHRRLGEASQEHVADIVVDDAILDELQVNFGALYVEWELAWVVTATDGDSHLRADGPANQPGHLVQRESRD